MNFYQKKDASVPAYATKYDDCTLKATGKPYRFQKGSGRSEILNNWAQDGLKMSELIKVAAEHGYDPVFTIGAVFRQHDTRDGAWVIEPPPGTTLEEIKGARAERQMSEEQAAKRAQREADKVAKAEARAAKKAELDAARAAREQEKAAAAQARAAARAASATAPAGEPSEVTGEAVKGRRGRKGKAPAAASETTGTAEAGVADASAGVPA